MGRPAKPIGSIYLNPHGVKYVKIANTGIWRQDWKTEGRILVEKILNRPLREYEKVIKLNGKKLDFNENNLLLINLKEKTWTKLDNNGNIISKSTYDWARLFNKCQSCTSTEKKHAAIGLCTSCYGKHIRQSGDLLNPQPHSKEPPSHCQTK